MTLRILSPKDWVFLLSSSGSEQCSLIVGVVIVPILTKDEVVDVEVEVNP
jgi:hypothetical protein